MSRPRFGSRSRGYRRGSGRWSLKLLRGAKFAEIGAAVGVSPEAAKMRFVRALEALREELEEGGIEP